MTSLDDTIISRQNLMLLDNVTNYQKPAIDYFHHEFNDDKLEIPLSWTLLLKMRKHKLLRLPSCSIEDDMDYNIYLVRLHHCLWRRWSINYYHLDKCKLDPLSINWNKETDVTVLYGPDLTDSNNSIQEEEHEFQETKQKFNKNNTNNNIHNKLIRHDESSSSSEDDDESNDDDTINDHSYLSSSIDSNTSSIFDATTVNIHNDDQTKDQTSVNFNIDPTKCHKVKSNTSTSSTDSSTSIKSAIYSNSNAKTKKGLKFRDSVLRRDIDKHGYCHESKVKINDVYAIRDMNLYDLGPRNIHLVSSPDKHQHQHRHHTDNSSSSSSSKHSKSDKEGKKHRHSSSHHNHHDHNSHHHSHDEIERTYSEFDDYYFKEKEEKERDFRRKLSDLNNDIQTSIYST
ncbi:uncharacterized protein NDAI_0H00600 [Naumovozyma dairenensis CBS 421]|uniref:Nitrogen regulatory protein areA GATA-like domain-containing protein n=1 Tax=Naumovozyma dairenensis (strain ATCC 10597 / BCRC 20456 / CBS 421 / NBRC 0211 / NRRL Y-12639) TaxID=1071378 RepID=G0WEM3_NAUDC|nr:hypothetical protein NDAI_0H00600 [Naumovozyma dairenensis CBS 421]CCD26234.1 hypothetical protein NDAI_0H00600 [Naumovozyma dairenensis CBS 421]